MSLIKSSLITGGSSLQTYLKDGNNLHTEYVGEWILIDDKELEQQRNYFWHLRDKDINAQLVSLWAKSPGDIYIYVQTYLDVPVFDLVVSSSQAANGYQFAPLVIPSNYKICFMATAPVSQLFLLAKEVAISESFGLSRVN